MLADIVIADVIAGFMLGLGLGILVVGGLYSKLVSRLNRSINDLTDLIERIRQTPDPDAKPDDDYDILDNLGLHDVE